MQSNIGAFGGARELLRFATTLVKSGDLQKRVFCRKNAKVLAYILSILSKSDPPLALQEAHGDNRNQFGERQTPSRFGQRNHENTRTY